MVGVGEVAVVADGEPAELEIGEQRLHVAQRHLAGRGIAHMAEGGMTEEPADDFLRAEILADMTHAAMGMELLAVIGQYPGGFVAAMLERVQAERNQRGGVGMAVNPEEAAFLGQMVVIVGIGCEHRCGHRAMVGRMLPCRATNGDRDAPCRGRIVSLLPACRRICLPSHTYCGSARIRRAGSRRRPAVTVDAGPGTVAFWGSGIARSYRALG